MILEQKRFLNIDIFKAIGILLVIIGHVGIGGDVCSDYKAAFQMPMFFFISGFLFKKSYAFFEYLKRKSISLIKPYFIYGIINLIFCSLIFSHLNLGKYIYQFFWINNNPPIPITGALWFLTCLFFVNIIYYLLNKYLKNYWLEIVLALLVLVEFIFKFKLPYSIDTAIYMLPIFYAGIKFKQIESKLDDKKYLLISLCLFILTFFTIFYNGHVNPRTNTYENILLFYFNAISMSYVIYYFSKFLSKIKYVNIINYIGKYSLEFMCVHQMLLKLIIINGITNKYLLLILTIFMITLGLKFYKFLKIKIQYIRSNK